MEARFRLPDCGEPEFAAVLVQTLLAQSELPTSELSLAAYSDVQSALQTIAARVPALPVTSIVRVVLDTNGLASFVVRYQPSKIQLSTGTLRLIVLPDLRRPDYDWNEQDSNLQCVTVVTEEERVGTSLADSMEINLEMQSRFAQAVNNVLPDQQCDVFHSSSAEDDFVSHRYSTWVPRTQTGAVLVSVCRQFDANRLEVTARIERFDSDPPASSPEAPQFLAETDLSVLRIMSPFATTFSLAPDGFSFPRPNIPCHLVSNVINSLFESRRSLQFGFMGRSFVAWKDEAGRRSSRTEGNFFRLELTSKKAELVVGIEQYRETDPSTRSFKSAIRNAVGRLGMTIR